MSLLRKKSLGDPDIQEQPVEYHRALREEPVFFDERLGFFICSTYKLMREVLRNTEVFSSVGSQTIDSIRPPPPKVLEIRAASHPSVDTLVTNDPPSHTRIRAMVDEPFRPRSIDKLKRQIREIVNETINAFIDDGACDMVRQFAMPIPIKVIADMLGIPRSLAPKIKAWSDAAVEPLGMMVSDERLIECTILVKEFQDYIVAELERRKSDPKDDLLTHLVQVRDESGVGLTVPEMLSLTQQFMVAGNETTTNGIAAGVQLLIDNPGQLAILQGDRDRILTFVNEVLRLEAPAQGLFRVVLEDTELNGVAIPKGSRVMLRFAAANRDGQKYQRADELDVTRTNSGTHVGFGAGIHHCIGANLAREEMVHSFDILLARLTNLKYQPDANDFSHHPSMILRGLKHLNITFEKA